MRMILILTVFVWMTAMFQGLELAKSELTRLNEVKTAKINRAPGISNIRQLSSAKPMIKEVKVKKSK